MVNPVTLIVSALITGAASAATDTASNAVKDAYSGLKTLLQKRFQGKPVPNYRTSLEIFTVHIMQGVRIDS
jgi:hypothetical protein